MADSQMMIIREVLSSDVLDPSLVLLRVRLDETNEGVIAMEKRHIDEIINRLICAKGYFDWPSPLADFTHDVSESEIASTTDAVAVRLTGLPQAKRWIDDIPAPAGHMTHVFSLDGAETVANRMLAAIAAARAGSDKTP